MIIPLKLIDICDHCGYKIVEFTSLTESCKIQCFECKEIKVIGRASSLFDYIKRCNHKEKEYHDIKEKYENLGWKLYDYKCKSKTIKVKCLSCGTLRTFYSSTLLKHKCNCQIIHKCVNCGESFKLMNKRNQDKRKYCYNCLPEYTLNDEPQITRQKLKRNKVHDYLISIFGNSCKICGYSEYFSALDFHHINPKNKTNSISRMVNNGFPLDEIISEAKKCILVCSNCHRKIHSGVINLQLYN